MRRLPGPRLTRDVLLVALTAAAGWTDALSYAALGHVFTANMTGNLVLLGLALARVEATTVERAAAALAGFAVGALAGSAIARGGPASTWPARVTVALGVEAALLTAFAGLWLAGGPPDGLIALAALGMGAQSSAVRRLDVPGVATTFVTGTITALMAGLATLRATGGPWRHAAVVTALVAGAVMGALTWSHWPHAAGLGPAALVAAVVLGAAWVRPEATP